MRGALSGCHAAFYLVHDMAGRSHDFRSHEVAAAKHFVAAAHAAGVGRIVYLGGVAPKGRPSKHLGSRLEVGRIFRTSAVPTIELRASMIIGYGSLSWLIVRDLAARLPFMILPRWLESRTEPVAIDDVLLALVRALTLPLSHSASFDLPGPNVLSGRAILEQAALALHDRAPIILKVPFLSPRLSSFWIRFVTRADWSVAKELVGGLAHDLIARDARYWQLIGHAQLIDFARAAALAIADEARAGGVHGRWQKVEHLRRLRHGA
jgi:uncharacterized protein YbjT (DUF2867 family)